MKKIIRWTVGNCSREGLECLKKSIKSIINLYNKEFDYYVFYNILNLNKIEWLNNFPVFLVNQRKYTDELLIRPVENNPCWKLYPPRVDINSYEIFIDNDIILHKKINFDHVIKYNYFIITEAYKKSYGTLQNLNSINQPPYLNSGLFGITPGFDFKKEINNSIKKFNTNWANSHFEEQGLVSYIINKQNFKLINNKQIYICLEDFEIGEFGNHFVGLNGGHVRFWNIYKNKFL